MQISKISQLYLFSRLVLHSNQNILLKQYTQSLPSKIRSIFLLFVCWLVNSKKNKLIHFKRRNFIENKNTTRTWPRLYEDVKWLRGYQIDQRRFKSRFLFLSLLVFVLFKFFYLILNANFICSRFNNEGLNYTKKKETATTTTTTTKRIHIFIFIFSF